MMSDKTIESEPAKKLLENSFRKVLEYALIGVRPKIDDKIKDLVVENCVTIAETYAVQGERTSETVGEVSPLIGMVSTTPAELFEWLEDNSCDLRCTGQPTGGGDYTILWVVIEHYQAEPQEREIGYGKSPQKAIIDAMKDSDDPTKFDYTPN